MRKSLRNSGLGQWPPHDLPWPHRPEMKPFMFIPLTEQEIRHRSRLFPGTVSPICPNEGNERQRQALKGLIDSVLEAEVAPEPVCSSSSEEGASRTKLCQEPLPTPQPRP